MKRTDPTPGVLGKAQSELGASSVWVHAGGWAWTALFLGGLTVASAAIVAWGPAALLGRSIRTLCVLLPLTALVALRWAALLTIRRFFETGPAGDEGLGKAVRNLFSYLPALMLLGYTVAAGARPGLFETLSNRSLPVELWALSGAGLGSALGLLLFGGVALVGAALQASRGQSKVESFVGLLVLCGGLLALQPLLGQLGIPGLGAPGLLLALAALLWLRRGR